MALGSRNHWVEPLRPVVLDVLPGGFAQVEADYLVVGLHQGGDGAESGVADGRDAGDQVCGLKGHQRRFALNRRTFPRDSPPYCALLFGSLASPGRCTSAIGFSDPGFRRVTAPNSISWLSSAFSVLWRLCAGDFRVYPGCALARIANLHTAATLFMFSDVMWRLYFSREQSS